VGVVAGAAEAGGDAVGALHPGEGAGVAGRLAVGLAVGGRRHVQVALADVVVDRAGGVAVVAGGVVEGPGVPVVGAGGGVGGAAEGQARAERLAEDAGGRAGGGVSGAVVGDAVGR